MAKHGVMVVAHRGLHDSAPENSLESLQRVVEANRRGLRLAVEFDIRTTADGVPVINHDPRFRHVALEDVTYSGLLQRFGAKAPCLLEDAVEILRSSNVALINPEIKEQRNISSVIQALIPLRGRSVMVSSFDAHVVSAMRDRTDFGVGLLISQRSHMLQSSALSAARECGATALIPHHRQINTAFITKAHSDGLKIGTYTVNNSSTLRKHIEAAELDFVITDRPEMIIPEVQARAAIGRSAALDGLALALRSGSPVAQ